MMVVPVLITSCQVSLKPNSGPVASQTRMIRTASANAIGRPAARAAHLDNKSNFGRDGTSVLPTSKAATPPGGVQLRVASTAELLPGDRPSAWRRSAHICWPEADPAHRSPSFPQLSPARALHLQRVENGCSLVWAARMPAQT